MDSLIFNHFSLVEDGKNSLWFKYEVKPKLNTKATEKET